MIGIVAGAGKESLHAIRAAKSMGIEVIAFDGNERAEGLFEADRHYVADIRNPQSIVECMGDEKPDVVIPVPIGRYLISGAYLNDYYGLKGISWKAAQACTDKYEFHQKLSDKGLRASECILVPEGSADVSHMPGKYPVIVKPRYGSGSRFVAEYFSEEQLRHGFMEGLPYPEDYIIESAFAGTEYGIDGAVIHEVLHIILIRKKILTDPPVRQCVGYLSVQDEAFYTRVGRYVADVVKELGLNQTVFHADIMDDGKDISVIELSGRPSGHYLHDIFTPYATGVDMVEEYLKFCIGKPYSFKPHGIQPMLIRYFDFNDVFVLHVPDEQELLKKFPIKAYECAINEGTYLGSIRDGHSIMGRGYFILEGKNEEELIQIGNRVLGQFLLQDGGKG